MTNGADDDELIPEDGSEPTDILPREAQRAAPPGTLCWKVAVIDDDADVHVVTRLALGGLLVDGYPVRLLAARSAAEGRRLLETTSDVALVLLDVVMEADDAGLRLAQWLRAERGDKLARIVLRTGQPGLAPESAVMSRFDVHDYLAKSELSAQRLRTAVIGGVRAFRDLKMLTLQRSGLKRVITATGSLFGPRDAEALLGGILEQVTALLLPREHAVFFVARHPLFAPTSGGPVILAASGRFAGLVGAPVEEVLPHSVLASADLPDVGDGWRFVGEDGLFGFALGEGLQPCLYLEGAATVTEWERETLALFCANAAVAMRDHRRQLEREARLASAERLLPRSLLRLFGADDLAALEGRGPRSLAVLFVACRGSEGSLASVVRLNALLSVHARGGALDARRGDGVLLLLPLCASDAMAAALDLRRSLVDADLGGLGVTLAVGDVSVAAVVGEDTVEVSVTGEAVDLAIALGPERLRRRAEVLMAWNEEPVEAHFDPGWGGAPIGLRALTA
jgi:CheY-like chemotaxis protein